VIVPGEQGESEGVWSIVRDVTDAVNAEEKRKSLELDLYQAQKMETVGRLAGGIAHDFNNLLTVILGYAEMLIGTNTFDDHSREHLGLIHHAALKARDLTRNLLSFSRRKLFNLSPVDVNEVVKDFSRLLERIVGEETEFRLALNPTPLVVLGDRSQLDQVLMNLVVNARDSMTKGGVLTVETGVANRNGSTGLEGDYATIKVSDTGCGMDEETVSHIFEPFFSTKSRDKGTGLGLATTYGIVNQHGGSISVNTKPGHGTSMVVFLPVTNQTISLSEGDTPEGALPDGSATILVMEDDPVVRSLSVQLLRSNGYDVIEASDSHEAVAMCASYEGPLHLILSDLVMPGMSGIEACEEIRKLHPETRVLFMSGYEEEANASRIVGWKPEGFIQKPFTISNLLDKCRQILGHG
jgi:nitrogen-specific signal transduction histidine kinase